MNIRKTKGFTLLEILIASILLFICISIAVLSFNAGSSNFARSKETLKAYQDCQDILMMITTELREADPTSIPVGSGSSVSFIKYHNPTSEKQAVTWELVPGTQKVRRRYLVSSSGKTGSTEFGENISDLTITVTGNVARPPIKKVKVSLSIQGKAQVAGEGKRNITKLDTEVCLRQGQMVKIFIKCSHE